MMASNTRKTDKSLFNTKDLSTFRDIGGLEDILTALKDAVIIPLVYPNLYSKFKVKPPRGVLFHGPPGTGKTLVAGALAKECSNVRKVTFFSRKGSDVLNKWVGESELRLRKLFQSAVQRQPSIIFFDEIDGLAPIRSDRHEQVHSSIVSTLLALMDGIDNLTGVVVIGATNRLDSIDPALRRSGRFGRELYFPKPSASARAQIINIHTRAWSVQPESEFISYLADLTTGYVGADLQALCSEAVMCCLQRNYPEIRAHSRINVRMKNLTVEKDDFLTALSNIKPTVLRERGFISRQRLNKNIETLLQYQLNCIVSGIKTKWPHFLQDNFKYKIDSTNRYTGRLLLKGHKDQGHDTYLTPAILHAFEHLPFYVIDIPSLFQNSNLTAEELCVKQLADAKQNFPSILLAYRLDEWWDIVTESTRAVILSLLESVQSNLPLLIIVTITDELPDCLGTHFYDRNSIILTMRNPNETERNNFFYPLFMGTAYDKCVEFYSENDKTELSEKPGDIDIQRYGDGLMKQNCDNMSVSMCRRTRSSRKRSAEQMSVVQLYKQTKFNADSELSMDQTTLDNNNGDQVTDTAVIDKKPTEDIKPRDSWFSLNNIVRSIKYKILNMDSLTTDGGLINSADEQVKLSREEIHSGPLLKKLCYLFYRTANRSTRNATVTQLDYAYCQLEMIINNSELNARKMLTGVHEILRDFERKRQREDKHYY